RLFLARGGEEDGIAGVARRDHDRDTALDQAVDLHAQGALATAEPARVEIVAEAHVDAVHEEPLAVLVPSLNLVDGEEEPAHLPLAGGLLDRGGAVPVGDDLEAHQLAARGDP